MEFRTIAVIFMFVGLAAAENVKPLRAISVLADSNGRVYGNVTFSQNGCGNPVLVEVSIVGLSPGPHGFHIHEKGDLSNGCMSTGTHYNPDKLDHGAPNDQVRHVGDLGNIVANEGGIAETKVSDTVITLHGARSVLGRAVVVHTGEDDLGRGTSPDSKKTGNAGGRTACGVIGILSPTDVEWPCSSASKLIVIPVLPLIALILTIT